jgi:hypothetical protein
MTQADIDDAGGDAPRPTTQEKKDFAELRPARRRREMEDEILKRAVSAEAGAAVDRQHLPVDPLTVRGQQEGHSGRDVLGTSEPG